MYLLHLRLDIYLLIIQIHELCRELADHWGPPDGTQFCRYDMTHSKNQENHFLFDKQARP